jgi:hypothetical protein
MTENTRYILAVMLERKKQLKQTGTRETEEATFLVYEHIKSGEVYIIRDPELKLAQIEEVQKEVSRLLTGGGGAEAPVAEPGPVDQAEAPVAESEAVDLAVIEEEPAVDDPGFDEVVVDEVPAREVSGEGVTSEEMAEREQS